MTELCLCMYCIPTVIPLLISIIILTGICTAYKDVMNSYLTAQTCSYPLMINLKAEVIIKPQYNTTKC